MGERFDIAVIGGGPGGYVAAIHAAQRGKRVLLAEGDALGGVCLNRGCIPTKALLKCASAYRQAGELAEFGVTTGEVRFDFAKMMDRKNLIVKGLTGGVGSLLKANGVTVVKGWATVPAPGKIVVNDTEYEAEDVILATGSVPFIPPIPGVDGPNVMTSDDVLSMESLPSSLAIIGGGVIGIELAMILSQLGCEVTIVEMLDSILSMADGDAVKELMRALRKQKIQVCTGARVTAITPTGLTYDKAGVETAVTAEKVLVAIGRRARCDQEMLDRLGVAHDRGRIKVDEHLCTSIPHIYAIGDVNGVYMLAHVASEEGVTAVNHICGDGDASMSYDAVPQCVYCTPEIAWVGLTEQAARDQGMEISVGKFPLSANGKSQVDGATAGFVKVIAQKDSGRVLGFHLVGGHATEMLMEGVLAVKEQMTAGEIASAIHPHPSVSESVMEAALAAATGMAHHCIVKK